MYAIFRSASVVYVFILDNIRNQIDSMTSSFLLVIMASYKKNKERKSNVWILEKKR